MMTNSREENGMDVKRIAEVIIRNAEKDRPSDGIFYCVRFRDRNKGEETQKRLSDEMKVLDEPDAEGNHYFFADDAEDLKATLEGIGYENLTYITAQWDM